MSPANNLAKYRGIAEFSFANRGKILPLPLIAIRNICPISVDRDTKVNGPGSGPSSPHKEPTRGVV